MNMELPADHLTNFDRLAASKEARRVVIDLRNYADENDCNEQDRAEILALVIAILQQSHL